MRMHTKNGDLEKFNDAIRRCMQRPGISLPTREIFDKVLVQGLSKLTETEYDQLVADETPSIKLLRFNFGYMFARENSEHLNKMNEEDRFSYAIKV